MGRSSAAKRRPLEILRRPEGGLGETGPLVVSPSRADAARRDVLEALHQLIDALTEPANERSCKDNVAGGHDLPLLLNAAETGQLLSVSRAKVLDLAARGAIPSVRIGGSVRIPRDRLTAWIAEEAQVEPNTTRRLPNWVRVNRSHEA